VIPPAGALPRSVLDSDVIYSRVLHELMGRLAHDARLFDLIWSDELIAEARRVLIEYKGLDVPVAERWVGYMRTAFPAGRVDPRALPAEVDLANFTRDPEDEFVCALAIAGRARLLFTFDRGYLQPALEAFGVEVHNPDAWLADVIDQEPAVFTTLVPRQAASWGGGRSVEELLEAFERASVPVFASKARALLDL
jgi:predicted nucleic acid-binding protein